MLCYSDLIPDWFLIICFASIFFYTTSFLNPVILIKNDKDKQIIIIQCDIYEAHAITWSYMEYYTQPVLGVVIEAIFLENFISEQLFLVVKFLFGLSLSGFISQIQNWLAAWLGKLHNILLP